MKFLSILSIAATLAAGFPVSEEGRSIEERQFGMTENDLDQGNAGACPQAIFIFARGSTEMGNMGGSVGPLVANGLKQQYGDNGVWIQGVGNAYTAQLAPNALPAGTDQGSINEAIRLFTLANTKCPNTPVVCGGYSQGSAVIGNALTNLNSNIAAQVKGAALFGYTKNLQNNGQIPNFPPDKTKVYCNMGDAVCTGTLAILPAHLMYQGVASGDAPRWLISKINGS